MLDSLKFDISIARNAERIVWMSKNPTFVNHIKESIILNGVWTKYFALHFEVIDIFVNLDAFVY